MSVLTPGESLSDRFTTVRLLGTGGMGEVWLAEDNELNERVAVKVIHPALAASPGMEELLKSECRNARRLVHPNIVRVFDFHRTDANAFISMSYIDGSDLGRFRQAPLRNVLSAIIPITDALQYAHGLGVVHRDLKLSNILCDRAGVPHLADFGIAAAIEVGGDSFDATTGGSLNAISPQQLMQGQPHPADDVYALGVVLYELVTGRPPFYPDISPDKVKNDIPVPIQIGPEAPGALSALVARMLAKAPVDRPQSMLAIKAELEALQPAQGDLTAPPQPLAQPLDATRPRPLGRDTVELIAPSASPPTAPRAQVVRSTGKRTALRAFLFAVFTLLVAGVAAVFFYLPDVAQDRFVKRAPPEPQPAPAPPEDVEPPPEDVEPPTVAIETTPQPQTTPAPTAIDTEQLARDRAAAEEALGEFLRKQSLLESQNVTAWAGDDFARAIKPASDGDEYLRKKEYARATRAYTNAVAALDALTRKRAQLLSTALTEGAQALDRGDGKTALDRFTAALQIEPDNALAKQGLSRAKTMDQVLEHYRAAQTHENNSELGPAREHYEKAYTLDPAFDDAAAGLARVKGKIAEQAFQEAMSTGLAALNGGNFEAARSALKAARKMRPSSRDVQDALAQVEEGIRLRTIARHRDKASAFERDEGWKEAAEQYQAVLNIDPTIRFAQEGKARSLRLAELSARLDRYLGEPRRLASQTVYNNALTLIREAGTLEGTGPKFTQRVAALEAATKIAATPIRIELRSDNLTEIAVYKVGKLGRFERRELELRPGTYTVVGTRSGYRDVRRKITVEPGQALEPVVVRCEEKV